MKQVNNPTRECFQQAAFPGGIPALWCPPLTHYDRHGGIDASRIARHLRHLSANVRGFLIPGSTGDGWELTPDERREVLGIALEQAEQLNTQVLIGALHPDSKEAVKLIREDIDWVCSRFKETKAADALAKAHVCGFTVCSQRGQHLTQNEIGQSLASILELRLPTAIYQLPQVTQNEMSPELVADLAQRYQNFVFFKDTSGSDSVALSGKDLGGVFTARGAEGQYSRWLKASGGLYDGFLLSSANCFAHELDQVIDQIRAGKVEAARHLSDRIDAVVAETFRLATSLPHGNPFANGNKAIDHFFAHGPEAVNVPAPRLHAGTCLPVELVHSVGQILTGNGLMPKTGYLRS